MTIKQLSDLIKQIQDRLRNSEKLKSQIESKRPQEMQDLMDLQYMKGATEALQPIIDILQKVKNHYEKEKS